MNKDECDGSSKSILLALSAQSAAWNSSYLLPAEPLDEYASIVKEGLHMSIAVGACKIT
jgi:hypothetical protein